MPLTFRFLPPIGGILYWLRAGHGAPAALARRVPFTRGCTRRLADVALYAGVLASAYTCCSRGGDAVAGRSPGA